MMIEIMFVLFLIGIIGMGFMVVESDKQTKRAENLAAILDEKNKFISEMSVTLEDLKLKSEEREKALNDAIPLVEKSEQRANALSEKINELTDMINNDREYIIQLEDENTKLSAKLKKITDTVKAAKKPTKKATKAK